MAEFRLTGGSLTLPDGVVNSAAVSGTSGQEIDADKLQHLHIAKTDFGHAIGDTPTGEERIVFVCQASSATLRGFHATLNDTGTSTDIDFNIKKNGTTMLSSDVNFTNADSDGTVKDGTLSVTSIATDDIISISCAITSSTGAQGPFAWANIEEVAVT